MYRTVTKRNATSVADLLGVRGKWGVPMGPGRIDVTPQKAQWRIDIPPEQKIPSWTKIDSPYFTLGGARSRIELSVDGENKASAKVWSEHGTKIPVILNQEVDHIVVDVDAPSEIIEPPAHSLHTLTVLGEHSTKWTVGLGTSAPSGMPKNILVSPPCRLHHVLLGDMWFELHPNQPHERYVSIFFRLGQPDLTLQTDIRAGPFSKTLIVKGGISIEEAQNTNQFLGINLDAPKIWTDAEKGQLDIMMDLTSIKALPSGLG